MQAIGWYINRLKLMSPWEIAWRLVQSTSKLDSVWQTKVVPTPVQPSVALRLWGAPAIATAQPYAKRADEICAGTVQLFGLPTSVGSRMVNWNRDPFSGVVAPERPGPSIDYRDSRLVGNARNIWELNRHFQLVELGQAWTLTGDDRYREEARLLLSSWLQACPYPVGINWVSALEHGVRIINWYFASRLFGFWSRGAEEPVPGWRDSIYWHCRFIWRHQSRYSSANNHLIGEMAGLYVAACAWPCWRESKRWRTDARRILLRELERQINADGVSREQTTGYQMFVLQLLIAAGLAGEEHGDPFPREYWTVVRGMIGFLRSITDTHGHLPAFGDSDDGIAYVLSPEARERRLQDLIDLDDLYSSGVAPGLTDSSAAKWFQSGFVPPVNWPPGPYVSRSTFPDGGYYVLAHHRGLPDEVLVVVDAAPLGYLSIAAHGHADCLSLVLSVAGEEMLIDPGTFCYHSDPVWRDYFRSTAAHNTVRIDGVDQSVMAGPFMWLHRAVPTVHGCAVDAPLPAISASHDGYLRLHDPVRHRRTIELNGAMSMLHIIDDFECLGDHGVDRCWHVGPGCHVKRLDDGSVEILGERTRLVLRCSDAESIELRSGSEIPRAGWVSRSFGVKEPSFAVIVSNRITGATRLATTFQWSGA